MIKMDIADLISMSDGCDDKVYFKIKIIKLDGTEEMFQDRIVYFPYDWESVEIQEMNFSGFRGYDLDGRPKPSIFEDMIVKQIKDDKQTGCKSISLVDGVWWRAIYA